MQQEQRLIELNKRDHNLSFCLNEITTSKYTMLNFIPKALLLQFMRIANIYFLVTAVLQSIPLISPLAPFSAISPLALVLAVSLLREAIEDYRKHRNDDMTNNQGAFLFNNYVFQNVTWKTLRVGDIIQVQEEQIIPADILLLKSSNEDGVCYVETANLDGEINLKTKIVNQEIQSLPQPLGQLQGRLICDKPNNRIHKFNGTLTIFDQQYAITQSNILLRGIRLKNTKYAIGMVVYSGHDCKIVKNQGSVRYKTTHIEENVNIIVILILALQALCCLAVALLCGIETDLYEPDKQLEYSYIYGDSNREGQVVMGVLTYFAFFLLTNGMIPISLIISLETLKFLQTTFMEYDEQMQQKDDIFKVLNSLIHEELGRIEYVFSDKTGTLTCNEMVFRGCCITGIRYGESDLEEILKADYQDEELTSFVAFWLQVAICHDVLVDQDNYQGSSPDEVALVLAASRFDFKFLKRTNNTIFIKMRGQMLIYEILCQIDFNSDRKRMTIIVKDMQTEKAMIITKGADNVIWKRLKIEAHQEQTLQLNQFNLKRFSQDGLRTLCYASKEVNVELQLLIDEYRLLLKKSEENSERLREIEAIFESDLILTGVSALEDRLQDDVPETISELQKAGMKVWMLTGDKLETAENIGHLCNLLDKNTKTFRICTDNVEQTFQRFKKINKKLQIYLKLKKQVNTQKQNQLLQRQLQFLREASSINSHIRSVHTRISHKLSQKSKPVHDENQHYAMIIEGEAISFMLTCKEIQTLFLEIIPHCRAVICCRSTPHQKAEIVQFVKSHLKAVTLAIGDGGNDVNMIQEAHIGVGILGKEGNQAAMCSDYFFCKFKYLNRLLLVHGRWSYYRTAYFINYFFFKNIVFNFQQFYFAFYSAYSGQTFFEDGYLMMYNTLITAWAPIYYGFLDQDLDITEPYMQKQLSIVYKKFKGASLFGWASFAKWYVSGLLCSGLIFFSTMNVYKDQIIDENGHTDGLWGLSINCFWSTVMISFMVVVTDSHRFTYITLISYFVMSFMAFFPVFTCIWNEFNGNVHHLIYDIMGNLKFYLVIGFNLGLTFVIKIFVNIWTYHEYPNAVQQVLKDFEVYTPPPLLDDLSEQEIPLSVQSESHIQAVQHLSINPCKK